MRRCDAARDRRHLGSRTITAVDDAPAAVGDSYTVTAGATSNIATASGVLVNDTDDDSLHAAIRAVIASGPSHGSLTLNPDGSFSYTPAASFAGTDTFTYVANDGSWSGDATVPMSGNSGPATVVIRVTYGFVNVQNLPPSPGKTVSGGSAVLKCNYDARRHRVELAAVHLVGTCVSAGTAAGCPGDD